MTALDRIELQEVEIMEREGFKIDDANGAVWAFRKLQAIERKANETSSIAQGEIERIKAWQEQEQKGIESDKVYFEGLLKSYYMEQRESDPKFKLSTPYGKVSSRKMPTWNYDDEKVLAYLQENELNSLIRVKRELDKQTIKKTFDVAKNGTVVNSDTGEVVPGIKIMETESITVKVEV